MVIYRGWTVNGIDGKGWNGDDKVYNGGLGI
jgi:hypothetical protein